MSGQVTPYLAIYDDARMPEPSPPTRGALVRDTSSGEMHAWTGDKWVAGPLVTPEMIEAADRICSTKDRGSWEELTTAIYRAMHAAAPVPLVTPAEDRVVALEREVAALHDALKARTAERDWYAEEHRLAIAEVVMMASQIKAKDARLAELDTLLAQRPAPGAEPERLAHNPFREHATDRRRLGPPLAPSRSAP